LADWRWKKGEKFGDTRGSQGASPCSQQGNKDHADSRGSPKSQLIDDSTKKWKEGELRRFLHNHNVGEILKIRLP